MAVMPLTRIILVYLAQSILHNCALSMEGEVIPGGVAANASVISIYVRIIICFGSFLLFGRIDP